MHAVGSIQRLIDTSAMFATIHGDDRSMGNEIQRIDQPGASAKLPTAERLAVGSGGERLTRGERDVIDGYRTQTAIIKGQAAKAIYASQQYSALAQRVHDSAVETLTQIDQTQQASKNPTIQAFCEREKQIYSYQALEMLTITGQRLNDEVERSLHPPPRRRLFER
jgi:hypothetical protein